MIPQLFQAVIGFALETAIWEQLGLKRSTAYMPTTKNGEERTVPLLPKAISLLKGLPKPEVPQSKFFGYTLDSIIGTMHDTVLGQVSKIYAFMTFAMKQHPGFLRIPT